MTIRACSPAPCTSTPAPAGSRISSASPGETGGGANRNVPLAPGAADAEWLAAIAGLLEWMGDAKALVVALGVDAAASDPESPLAVSRGGFRAAGRAIGASRKPTVLVQEGGYDLDAIGELVRETLAGFEEGRRG